MIEARHLTKHYGTVVAVQDLSFQVGAGEVIGFLGPNGAGKSTTLRMLAGFLGATSGHISINGHDIVTAGNAARRCIGYMPEMSPLYPELRVREYLSYRAELKRVPRRARAKAVDRALELAVVRELQGTLIQHLSRGYRQRVGLADALLSNPPLLILDEPTAGLDPNQIREVRRLIRELGQEHTILLSTHILPEVEAVCERALVIHRGHLVAEGSLQELGERRQADTATVLVSAASGQASAQPNAVTILKRVPGVKQVKQINRRQLGSGLSSYQLRFSKPALGGSTLEQAIKALVEAGYGIREAQADQASLEDVFAQLTGKQSEP